MKVLKIVVLVIILVLGITLISIPFISTYKINQNMESVSIDNIKAETLEENEKVEVPEEDFDFEKVEPISSIKTAMTVIKEEKPKNTAIVGELTIPSIGLKLSILKGVTNANLLAGAATMRADAKMGKGNYPLCGHYNLDKSVLFGGLMDVKVGDKIMVTNKKTIYEYEVTKTILLPDTALYMIEDEEAEAEKSSIITLMTCDSIGKTNNRYFVRGKLVEKYKYQ